MEKNVKNTFRTLPQHLELYNSEIDIKARICTLYLTIRQNVKLKKFLKLLLKCDENSNFTGEINDLIELILKNYILKNIKRSLNLIQLKNIINKRSLKRINSVFIKLDFTKITLKINNYRSIDKYIKILVNKIKFLIKEKNTEKLPKFIKYFMSLLFFVSSKIVSSAKIKNKIINLVSNNEYNKLVIKQQVKKYKLKLSKINRIKKTKEISINNIEKDQKIIKNCEINIIVASLNSNEDKKQKSNDNNTTTQYKNTSNKEVNDIDCKKSLNNIKVDCFTSIEENKEFVKQKVKNKKRKAKIKNHGNNKHNNLKTERSITTDDNFFLNLKKMVKNLLKNI